MAITKIAEVTVGSGGVASIDFTSIPGTYTDLMVVFGIRSGRANHSDEVDIKFNGVTTNLSGRYLSGDGASAGSGSVPVAFAGYSAGSTATANTFGNGQVYIPNYSGATAKSFSAEGTGENNATNSSRLIFAGLWNSTAAITSLSLYSDSANTFQQYSTATLYGIQKGSLAGVTVS